MTKKADGMISGSVWIRITAGCTVGTALTLPCIRRKLPVAGSVGEGGQCLDSDQD